YAINSKTLYNIISSSIIAVALWKLIDNLPSRKFIIKFKLNFKFKWHRLLACEPAKIKLVNL
ncbi:MAG: hypothetical protein ACKPJH_18340, partial [Dolichospermum sp.]